MEKEFIPYGLALRMKVIGFDEPCLAIYDNITNENDKDDSDRFFYIRTEGWPKELFDKVTPVPLFSQAFRWFREKYSYQSFISPSNELTYLAYDFTLKGFDGYFKSKQFKTYEEAELACLEKLIEIVETK